MANSPGSSNPFPTSSGASGSGSSSSPSSGTSTSGSSMGSSSSAGLGSSSGSSGMGSGSGSSMGSSSSSGLSGSSSAGSMGSSSGMGSSTGRSGSMAGGSGAEGDNVMSRVVQGAHEAVDRIAAKAGPTVERLRSSTGSMDMDELSAMQREWMESARMTVREHPLAAVAVGVAAGVLLSRLLSSR